MVNELYRQAVHLIGGLAAAVAAFIIPQHTFLWLMGIAIAAWLILVFFFADRFTAIFMLLERDNSAFRGKGAVFYGLGALLTGMFFWEQTGWALLVLAIPDALATIIGKLYRSTRLPYNHRKSVLGSAAFFLSSVIILSIGRPFVGVLLIAFFLTALESFDYREIPFLDDNLVIPVVAGYLLSII